MINQDLVSFGPHLIMLTTKRIPEPSIKSSSNYMLFHGLVHRKTQVVPCSSIKLK